MTGSAGLPASVPATALDWSLQAMLEATNRVNMVHASTVSQAFAAIGESVWWITMVDDNIRARYGKAYNRAAKGTVPHPGETMRGLRSVRNRIGHEVEVVDFIVAIGSRSDRGDGRISAWAWQSVPSPRSRAPREVASHRAYETALAGNNIVHTFGLASGFLQAALNVAHDPKRLS
jgi:hypothetical protein